MNKLPSALPSFFAFFVLLQGMALPQESATSASPAPQAEGTDGQDVAAAFAGHWEGEIAGASLGIELDLALDEGGAWSGTISIPAQRLVDRALVDFAFGDDVLRFSIEGVPGKPTFEATFVDGDPDALEGPFRQGPAALSFRVERVEETAALTADELDGIRTWIDGTREAWHVPGLGVAIVTRDGVLLAEGFGTRGLGEDAAAVDADTLFAIGSSTKAFTTMLLGTLVDAGELDWEDRVDALLPGFGLYDEEVGRRLTVRDLVTHRSGLPRHDFTWYGQDGLRTTREIVLGMRHLEPNAGLRERFQYNNLGFVAAGEVLAELTGSPWHALLRERILTPLGMTRSTSTAEAFLADGNHALGTERKKGASTELPLRVIDHVGAAGSISSSANEMARWARLHLSGGSLDGTTLVQAGTLAELHTPAVVVPSLPTDPMLGISALAHGWFVDGYRGHLRLQHGGNIDGFSAMVALFPNDDLGVVVLANANGSPVPEFVVRHVADVAFGLEPRDWSGEALALVAAGEEPEATAEDEGMEPGETKNDPVRVEGTSPSHGLGAYAGTFEHPGYGPIQVVHEDALTLKLGRLTGALEHWHYDTFRVVEGDRETPLTGKLVRFETNVQGQIEAVHIALEDMVDPIRFTLAADPELSAPEQLAAYAGTYGDDRFTITFELRGDELVGVVPGQEQRALVPTRPDTFDVEGLGGFSIHFRRAEDGAVTAVELRQPNGTFVVERQ